MKKKITKLELKRHSIRALLPHELHATGGLQLWQQFPFPVPMPGSAYCASERVCGDTD